MRECAVYTVVHSQSPSSCCPASLGECLQARDSIARELLCSAAASCAAGTPSATTRFIIFVKRDSAMPNRHDLAEMSCGDALASSANRCASSTTSRFLLK